MPAYIIAETDVTDPRVEYPAMGGFSRSARLSSG
jgi:hypothetical protein